MTYLTNEQITNAINTGYLLYKDYKINVNSEMLRDLTKNYEQLNVGLLIANNVIIEAPLSLFSKLYHKNPLNGDEIMTKDNFAKTNMLEYLYIYQEDLLDIVSKATLYDKMVSLNYTKLQFTLDYDNRPVYLIPPECIKFKIDTDKLYCKQCGNIIIQSGSVKSDKTVKFECVNKCEKSKIKLKLSMTKMEVI